MARKRLSVHGRVGLVALVGLVVFGLAAGVTSAGAGSLFPEAGLSPTAGISEEPVVVFGEAFYNANYPHFNWDGFGSIVLSANQDGTGFTLVDDKIMIKVFHSDGTSSIFRHDYSHGCSFSSSLAPTNVTSLFHLGNNKISVVLSDGCGGLEGSNSIWLTKG
jgi:hypothetical protein